MEQKLKRMERGEIAPDAFMRDIAEMVRALMQDSHPVPEGGVLFADTRKSIACVRDAAARCWKGRKASLAAIVTVALHYGATIVSLLRRKRD
jgi:hypothetical protein